LVSEQQELVYGIHAVRARLRSGRQGIQEIWILKSASGPRLEQIRRLAEKYIINVSVKSRYEMDQAIDGVHQGVALICVKSKAKGEDVLEQLLMDPVETPALLILDGITDPHNLGACLRNAAALEIQAVIAPKDRAVGLTPAAIKAASGAAERVPFIQVTNLARCMDRLKQLGVWIVGTAVEDGQPLHQVDLTVPVALVMGSEGKGLRNLTRQKCDSLAYIPIDRDQESLNVSVASGICLYEMRRQRGQ